MNLKEILFIFSFLFFSFYTLIYLELFARKEYRLDRLRAQIEDFGLRELFWPPEFRRPKISHPRNILILFIILLIFIFLYTLACYITCPTLGFFFIDISMWLAIVFFSMAPLTSLICIIFATILSSIPVIIYRKIIISIATKRIAKYKPLVIGVTGSYGKSTTKSYIAHILREKYKVVETPKNTNTDIGIALTVLNKIHEKNVVFVAEIGAYRRGEIRSICRMLRPKMGVITAFGTQHSSLFGGKEAIIQAKCELAQELPATTGKLCICESEVKKIPPDIRHSITCQIHTYKLANEDDPHLQVVQAATCLASNMGMSFEEIQRALEKMNRPQNLKMVKPTRGFNAIVSCYSTNTKAFLAHISLLKKSSKKQKIIITPGIIELGKDKHLEYKKIAGAIPKDTLVFTTDPYFRKICIAQGQIAVMLDRSQKRLFAKVRSALHEDCAILIEGRFRRDIIDKILS